MLANVLGSGECRVVLLLEIDVSGRKVDRRVLAMTSMQNLGSSPVFGVGPARWPDGPTQSGVAHGFSLISVSGVGVVLDGVKTRGNGISGTARSDMVVDGVTL